MMKRLSSAFALASLALVAGCEGSKSNEDATLAVGEGDPNRQPDGGGGPSNIIDAGAFTINANRSFQTKSAAQLASSVRACFGQAAMTVTADMIQPSANAILPSTFVATTGANDIIAQQKAAFDGDQQLLRTGTRADSLTLEYVTAQRNVANVVAVNCAAGASPELCKCGTLPEATAMVRRCIPQLDPTAPDLLNAALTLQVRCAQNQRQAIASLVASAALSKLP